MATRWITKKGRDGRNRHVPIRERSRVRVKEIKIPDISENEEYKTIARFSVDGENYMHDLNKIVYGKYKKILLDSELINARFYVYGKRVKDITDIEKAGHGTFDYTLSKDKKKYVLFGNVYKDGNLWYMNAELVEKI